jgi:hypothetical protein
MAKKKDRIDALEEQVAALQQEVAALQREMTFIMVQVVSLKQNPLGPCPGYPPYDPWRWGQPNTGDPFPPSPIIWCGSQTSSDSTAPAARSDA